jgi:hypothetical protein
MEKLPEMVLVAGAHRQCKTGLQAACQYRRGKNSDFKSDAYRIKIGL